MGPLDEGAIGWLQVLEIVYVTEKPSGWFTSGQDADIMLSEIDFNNTGGSNSPGTGLNQMNWHVGVSADGKHVVVADTYNDRNLIWNTFPTNNNQNFNKCEKQL